MLTDFSWLGVWFRNITIPEDNEYDVKGLWQLLDEKNAEEANE